MAQLFHATVASLLPPGRRIESASCFTRIYQAAVELCAMLCRRYDLDPLADGVLICHSEGYQRGVAPAIQKLMEAKTLTGYADPDPTGLADNTLNIDDTYCRVMTTLDKMGIF